MDRYQKQVELKQLNNEKAMRETLKENYQEALEEIEENLEKLTKNPDNKNAIMRSSFQKELKSALEEILQKLGDINTENMTEFLQQSYEDGYLGCLYGMQKDGVDVVLIINEEAVEKALLKETADFNFSKRLYDKVDKLTESVRAGLSMGLSTGKDYREIARQIELKSEASLFQAYRIARTEGHRIYSESKMDSMRDARDKGADLLKIWDATVDSRTRQSHRELDGQIRELEEPFEINGKKAMYPGGFGLAGEDIRCRCAVISKPRWYLQGTDENFKYSRPDQGIISTRSDSYVRWKNEYLKEHGAEYGDSLRSTRNKILNELTCYRRKADE